jgi:peptide/nickel transport system ATP-binding protein
MTASDIPTTTGLPNNGSEGMRFVETGSVRDIIREPRHPYTRALLAANLHGVRKGERVDAIPGAPPALSDPPRACSFAPRCRFAETRCVAARPPEVYLDEGRLVRCILAEPARLQVA